MVDKWMGDHQERQGLLARLESQEKKPNMSKENNCKFFTFVLLRRNQHECSYEVTRITYAHFCHFSQTTFESLYITHEYMLLNHS